MPSSMSVDVFHPKFLLSTTVCSLMGRVGFLCLCLSFFFMPSSPSSSSLYFCSFVFMNQVSALPLSVAPNDNDRAHPYHTTGTKYTPSQSRLFNQNKSRSAGYFGGRKIHCLIDIHGRRWKSIAAICAEMTRNKRATCSQASVG